ncbi:MAG TPA: lipopolysaccharide assembly protein LapA domain-containing protein [Acidimicrobiales bacterium]|nr:lipopolysaccharide assembly protein LapA domain-containing protein [Acidimicrobiales bacterium]
MATPPDTSPQPRRGRPEGVAGTRTSHTWVALAAGLFFLIVVLVFILQNLKSVKAHFFWATWSIPLAVDLLLAAVLGALIMFTAGSLRIVQLRRATRRGRASGP